jgi:hypothetical protein
MKPTISATESRQEHVISPLPVGYVEFAQQPARGRKIDSFKKGDRVQVICPPGWSELAYANTGQWGTVQLIAAGKKLKGKIAIELDEPPAPGKRCDVWIAIERLLLLPLEPEGWNESEEGQNFWERFELLRPYLSKANLETGYFDRSLDYPRSFEWLEVLEGKRQLTLPLDPVSQSLQSAALATGDRVKVSNSYCLL